MKRTIVRVAVLVLFGALAACGGDDDSNGAGGITGNGGGGGGAVVTDADDRCSQLAACCRGLPADDQVVCQEASQGADEALCGQVLFAYQLGDNC